MFPVFQIGNIPFYRHQRRSRGWVCRRDKEWCGGWVGALCLSWRMARLQLYPGCSLAGNPTGRGTSTRPPHPLHTAHCPYTREGVWFVNWAPMGRDKSRPYILVIGTTILAERFHRLDSIGCHRSVG